MARIKTMTRTAAVILLRSMEDVAAEDRRTYHRQSRPPVHLATSVKIPAGDYIFRVQGIEIEGFNDVGVDVQYPWEDRRGVFTNIACISLRFSWTSTRSRMPTSRDFSNATHSSRGRSEFPARLKNGFRGAATNRSHGFRSKISCLRRLGWQALLKWEWQRWR